MEARWLAPFLLMLIEKFIEHLQFEKRYSAHTILAYRTDLEQFQSFLQEQLELDRPEHADHHSVRAWLVHLMESSKSSRSVNRKVSTLKSFYRFLRRIGQLQTDPMLKVVPPKNGQRLPEFVEEAKMKRLLDYMESLSGVEGLRDRCIIELFYQTGIRLSELIGLKDIDLDPSGPNLKVLGKRNKERIVPIGPMLLELLRQYQGQRNVRFPQADRTSLLLNDKGKTMSSGFVYRKVYDYLGLVTTANKKSPHVLRHTFATHMLNNGADLNTIKEVLGHTDLAATQVYTHNTIEQLKNVHRKSHPKG